MTDLYIPDDDELENMLSARQSIEARKKYVLGLLEPVRATVRMRENYEKEIRELQVSRDGMRDELRSLRIKLGDLDPASRNALDQRYDMLSKINRARGEVPSLRRELHETVDRIVGRMEEALKA